MADNQAGDDLITPDEAAKVQKVSGQVTAIREQAAALEVRNAQEAAVAAEFLGALKSVQREAEEIRVFIVKPLNDHVKAINARFKPNAQALEEAERTVKSKVISYNRVQEELRRQEQARIDAERAEREAQAAREQAEREAEARRQREEAEAQARAAAEAAAAAERERMEAIQRDENSRRARISKLPEDALQRIAAGGSEDAALAAEELGSRQAHKQAQEAAERAAAAEAAARAAEEAAAAVPEPQEPARTVAAPTKLAGTASRKRWTFEVTDAAALPAWALMPNEAEIRRRIREGLRGPVDGLRIYQEDELAVRAS